tara:strand:+ start:29 stop:154 length:126 start_codon:yes stop_codon:yes gene_type:complete
MVVRVIISGICGKELAINFEVAIAKKAKPRILARPEMLIDS